MAITYTWANADETSIKYVDDSTTPDTIKFIPVDTGNRDYNEYVEWEAESGNDIADYGYPGYDTIVNARASRKTEARDALKEWIRDNYGLELFKDAVISNYNLPSTIRDAISDAFQLLENLEDGLDLETSIEDVRTSTINYTADTYNIP